MQQQMLDKAAVMRLAPKRVDKIWGRRDLPAGFGGMIAPDAPAVGEIWFEDSTGSDRPLLIKYLFTSEKLSIQVHPGGEAARAAGYPRGKDEAWWILAAEEGATIALGLREEVSKERLRSASLDGSIQDLVDWRPVKGGDCIYSPAGTVHALGEGLTLIEIQENLDLTYRFYDYGRERPLQVDEAVAVAEPVPFEGQSVCRGSEPGRAVLFSGGAFVTEHWRGRQARRLDASESRPVWLIPIEGSGSAGDEPIGPGAVWLIEAPAEVTLEAGGEMLVAYPGAQPLP